jgi:integrase
VETTPFSPRSLSVRAEKAWAAAAVGTFFRAESAGLEPIGWHELRHTCASIFIAAGVNAKALSSYLGRSSIRITLDRYGHLMPGSEDEAVALVDAYLERSAGARAGASGAQTAQLRGLSVVSKTVSGR